MKDEQAQQLAELARVRLSKARVLNYHADRIRRSYRRDAKRDRPRAVARGESQRSDRDDRPVFPIMRILAYLMFSSSLLGIVGKLFQLGGTTQYPRLVRWTRAEDAISLAISVGIAVWVGILLWR